MAGSRLEKIGTVFSRMTGLLRSGVVKENDKPSWYDVYKTFPPVREPRVDRPVPTDNIRPIFYAEDRVRAFVDKYMELERTGDFVDQEEIFDAVVEHMKTLGVNLKQLEAAQAEKPMIKISTEPIEETVQPDSKQFNKEHEIGTQT